MQLDKFPRDASPRNFTQFNIHYQQFQTLSKHKLNTAGSTIYWRVDLITYNTLSQQLDTSAFVSMDDPQYRLTHSTSIYLMLLYQYNHSCMYIHFSVYTATMLAILVCYQLKLGPVKVYSGLVLRNWWRWLPACALLGQMSSHQQTHHHHRSLIVLEVCIGVVQPAIHQQVNAYIARA